MPLFPPFAQYISMADLHRHVDSRGVDSSDLGDGRRNKGRGCRIFSGIRCASPPRRPRQSVRSSFPGSFATRLLLVLMVLMMSIVKALAEQLVLQAMMCAGWSTTSSKSVQRCYANYASSQTLILDSSTRPALQAEQQAPSANCTCKQPSLLLSYERLPIHIHLDSTTNTNRRHLYCVYCTQRPFPPSCRGPARTSSREPEATHLRTEHSEINAYSV